GADIGVRIVAVDSPGLQRAFHDEVMTGTAHVVHNFFPATFLDCFANAQAEGFEHLGPGGALPLAATARAHALHGIEHAVGIMNLIDGGGAFGTKASPAGGMPGIALEFRDLARLFIYVREHSASGLAVEADGGNELIMLFDFAGPLLGVILHPIVPFLHRRMRREMASEAFEIIHINSLPLAIGHALPSHDEAPFKDQKSN